MGSMGYETGSIGFGARYFGIKTNILGQKNKDNGGLKVDIGQIIGILKVDWDDSGAL